MGWLYSHPTRAALVESLRSPTRFRAGCTVLKSRVIGSRHWYLIEGPDKVRMVGLDLLGVSDKQHGYKDMDETMGPYYYDCPAAWLDMCTAPLNEYSRAWRETVRVHAARKSERQRLVSGTVVQYGSHQYRLEVSLGRRGWDVTRVSDGMCFRMKARQLADATICP
jgi:hypothetical protein